MRPPLLFSLGLLGLLSCHPPAWRPPLVPRPLPDRAALVGRVLDGTTAHPLHGPTIRLLTPCGETPWAVDTADASGSFSFEDLTPGSYELQVIYIGYRHIRVPITLTPGVLDTIRLAVTPGPVYCSHCRPLTAGQY